MTRPMTHSARVEMLAEVTKLATNVNFGHRAWAARQDEMSAGYPSRGGAGGSYGQAVVEASDPDDPDQVPDPPRPPDPAESAAAKYDAKLKAALSKLEDLYRFQVEGSVPKEGLGIQGDPGCQSCERVVNDQTGKAQWSQTYSTTPVVFQTKKGKRAVNMWEDWRLCYWDYRFALKRGCEENPLTGRRHWRVAAVDEVAAHLDGRRVVVSA